MYGSSGNTNSLRVSTMLEPIMDVSNDNFSKADNDDNDDKSASESGKSHSHDGSSSGDFDKRRESLVVVPEIAGRENRLVLYSKLLVFAVLACSAAAVGILTFYFVSSEEENDYTAQVRSNKNKQVDCRMKQSLCIFMTHHHEFCFSQSLTLYLLFFFFFSDFLFFSLQTMLRN
jgi:hypothetical protein